MSDRMMTSVPSSASSAAISGCCCTAPRRSSAAPGRTKWCRSVPMKRIAPNRHYPTERRAKRQTMNHDDAIKSLAAERYILDDLDPAERDAFEEHFFDCTECTADVRDTAKV